jgi:hypothetical protein
MKFYYTVTFVRGIFIAVGFFKSFDSECLFENRDGRGMKRRGGMEGKTA